MGKITKISDTHVLALDLRTSYMSVFKAKLNEADPKNPKYEFTTDIIIPPDVSTKELEDVIMDVANKKWPNGLPDFKHPVIKDGNKNKNKDGSIKDGYEGNKYITVKSQEDKPPAVIDLAKKHITDHSEFQSGDFANTFINVWAYNKPMNKGISLELVTIQKKRDGVAFSGGISKKAAADAFDAFNEDDMPL